MSQDSWQEIKSKIESLGLKLKLHLDQENDDTDDTAEPGATKKAMEDLGDKLQEAFHSFGAASKDPAVRSDVKEIGTLLKDAMADTFSKASTEVSDAFKRSEGQKSDSTGSDSTGSDGTQSAGTGSDDTQSGDSSEPTA
jgi:hypothetical protein